MSVYDLFATLWASRIKCLTKMSHFIMSSEFVCISVAWQPSCFHTGRPAVQSGSHSTLLDSTPQLCRAFRQSSVTFSVWRLLIINAATTRLLNPLLFKSWLFSFFFSLHLVCVCVFLFIPTNKTLPADCVSERLLSCAASHLDVIFYEARRLDARLHVEADVHLHVRFLVGQLDDWHLGERGRQGETEKRTRDEPRTKQCHPQWYSGWKTITASHFRLIILSALMSAVAPGPACQSLR